MSILNIFERGKKIPPIYSVILKSDRFPTKSEVEDAIVFFVGKGKLENVSPFKNRIVPFHDPDMQTDILDGSLMTFIGEHLLKLYPDLNNYISISQKGFESNDLAINVVAAEFKCGYIRIIHMKQK